MGDLWADEGFGSGGYGEEGFGEVDDWDEGEESLETDIEEGFDDPDPLDEEAPWDDGEEDEV